MPGGGENGPEYGEGGNPDKDEAGDITGGVKQWIVACGEGAVAAISAYKYFNI